MKKNIIIIVVLFLGIYLYLNRTSKSLKQELDPLEYEQKKRQEYGDTVDKKIRNYSANFKGLF